MVVRGPQFGCTEERLKGFGETYAAAGLPITDDRIADGDFTLDGGRLAIKELLEAGVEFDAVFAHNDLSAAGVIQGLRDAGVTIPDDVAVVGFDDIPLAAHTEPRLTTVRQPLREMGTAAARMLLSSCDGAPLAQTRQVIPTTLIVRGSSVPP